MSLSDCEMCWDTPCTCGWKYRFYSEDSLKNLIKILNKVLEFKQQNPKSKFSNYKNPDDKKFLEYLKNI